MGNATSWPSSALILIAFWSMFSLISTCPTECTCSTWTSNLTDRVYCIHNNLVSVPAHIPQQVTLLDLHGNQIQLLNDSLKNLTNLKFLNLSFNNLASLNASVFDNLHKLKKIDISNNVISVIQPKAFSGLINIDQVQLSSNEIKCIDSDILDGLQSATLLNLSSNEINNISNDTFQFMEHLEILDLSNNKITVISSTMLKGMILLKTLIVENNQILWIAPESFLDLGNLVQLDMSNNQLTSLDKDVLSGLPNLTSLSVENNNIRIIDPQFMTNTENVLVLRFSGNSFQNISIPLFTMFGNLQELYLSNMPSLITIAFNAFDGLSNLLTLDLSHNTNLSFIHPDLLRAMLHLTKLDLSHNNISMLSKLTFLHNQHLRQVSLEANVFQCSCGIAWLAGSIQVNSSVFGTDNLKCAINDTDSIPLSMISSFELCPELIQSNVTEVEMIVKISSAVRLVCDFVHDPTTMVVWKTPRGQIFTYHPFHPSAASHLLSINVTDLSSNFHRNHEWHTESGYYSSLEGTSDHVVLLSDGSLYVDYILRTDAGPYQCLVQNSHYNTSLTISVRLVCAMFHIKIQSLIIGFSTAGAFLALTITYSMIMSGAQRLINKRRRDAIRKMLENLDTYKTVHFARLRDNYSNQLGRIRDQYHLQFGRLRENYSLQMKRVRKGCSEKVDRIRDNYTTQVGRLRQYSAHQIEQIREMYSNQLLKIRDYSSLQMGRMHEKYKLQQQHIIKLLETMNLENCKNVIDSECMRAESMIFKLNITDDDEQPLSPLGSDSEYLTATSSENSSNEDLCIPAPLLNVDINGIGECESISETMDHEPKEDELEKTEDEMVLTPAARPDSPVSMVNDNIKFSKNHVLETVV